MKNRVRIIAPASLPKGDTNFVLEESISFLTAHGFKVSVQGNIFSEKPHPYFANTKEIRANGVIEAVQDPEVDIIFVIRGGSGCAGILDLCSHMDKKLVQQKILIGFSDITSLHILFNQHYGVPSIHGNVLTKLNEDNMQEIIHILQGAKPTLKLTALNDAARNSGAPIQGTLTGGNLTVFNSLLGTKYVPDTKGKIVIFEDVNEPGYKVSRSLEQASMAGIFEFAKACILGDFANCPEDHMVAIQEFIDSNPSLPIYRAEGIGHGNVNHSLVFGNLATIIGDVLKCGGI